MTETLMMSVGHFLVFKQRGIQPISFAEDLAVIGSK